LNKIKKWASVELLSQESQETARKAAELERARILKKTFTNRRNCKNEGIKYYETNYFRKRNTRRKSTSREGGSRKNK